MVEDVFFFGGKRDARMMLWKFSCVLAVLASEGFWSEREARFLLSYGESRDGRELLVWCCYWVGSHCWVCGCC